MNNVLATIIGAVVTAFGSTATVWLFGTIRGASAQLKDRLANESLRRLHDIIASVVLDTGEVLTRSLVDQLKDGELKAGELQESLDEAAAFAWSLMRNADKAVLAGGTDGLAQEEFTPILKARLEAEARKQAPWFNRAPAVLAEITPDA